MASTKQSETTQVRKTISFSKRRDHELIEFINRNDDDFSYNAKQLMLDGLRFRQMMQTEQPNYVQSALTSLQQNYITEKQEKSEKESSESSAEKKEYNTTSKNEQWDELMEVETEEAEIDGEQLEKRLDDF